MIPYALTDAMLDNILSALVLCVAMVCATILLKHWF